MIRLGGRFYIAPGSDGSVPDYVRDQRATVEHLAAGHIEISGPPPAPPEPESVPEPEPELTEAQRVALFDDLMGHKKAELVAMGTELGVSFEKSDRKALIALAIIAHEN
tara:strand:- start:134 stop:460 length:327 start_codon:yes stop_codon:yes gene_type:complete